jgi:hypothetical protein
LYDKQVYKVEVEYFERRFQEEKIFE